MNEIITRMELDTPALHVPATPMDMLNKAVANGQSVEVISGLMALYERWEASQARRAFDAAIADAKAEIPVIMKNRTVDFTSSKGRTHYRHEDLAEVARTVTPILARYGLSYRFRTAVEGSTVIVTCVVSHRDGYSEETALPGPRDDSGSKNSIQAVGSTLTYLQRMTLKAALGLSASDDDDGKASGGGDEAEDFVSDNQLVALRDLIEAADADEAKFCAVMKVPSLAALPAKMFDAACGKLRARIDAMPKASAA